MCVWFLLSQLHRAHPQTNLGNAICRQKHFIFIRYTSVHLLSRVRLFATPWTAARQASLSITSSRSLPKLMSIKLVIPSNHLIFCHPLLLPPSIFPSIRIFSNESVLHIRWPKYWSIAMSKADKNPCLMELTFCGILYYWRDEGPFNSQLQIILRQASLVHPLSTSLIIYPGKILELPCVIQ